MATQRDPDEDIAPAQERKVDMIPDTAREVHPVSLFPTWDQETGTHIHRSVEDLYRDHYFVPGVKEAEPQKPADSGGTVKS